MVWNVVGFISYFIECLIIYAFVSIVFALRDQYQKKKWLAGCIFFMGYLGIVVYNQWLSTKIPVFFIGMVLQSLVAMIVFKGKVIYKILAVFSVYAALSAVDLVVFCVVGLLLGTSQSALTHEIVPYVTSFCISKIFLILILSLICQFKAVRNEMIKFHYWILLIVIPISSIISLFSILYSSYLLKPKGFMLVLAALASAGLLVINASVFYIFQKISESTRLQTQYYLMKQNVEDQYKRFREIENLYKQTKIFKHDLDKHISCIGGFLTHGQYQEALVYLNSLTKAEAALNIPFLSGNPVVDTIINAKYNLAKQNKIQMQIVISDADIPIEPIDLCAILSNLLDNAIESCEKIEDQRIERLIKIAIGRKNGGIVISVTNSFEEGPIVEDGQYVTMKQNKEYHGIGLKSVRQSVEKYDGIFESGFENNEFSAVVFFST